jgi:hypothetical protein
MITDICLILKNFSLNFDDKFFKLHILQNKQIEDFIYENLKNKINVENCLIILNQLFKIAL